MYKISYFNFRECNGEYLITNDAGKFSFLSKEEFEHLLKKEDLNEEKYAELEAKGFIYSIPTEVFATTMSMAVRVQKGYTLNATSLHIFVVSKNCNFRCIYCQAGNLNQIADYKMTKEIAKKSVDIAMQSPSKYLTFEFQGGEPLTNFEIIKYIIAYSDEIKKDKIIEYAVVSNLTLMTDEMMNFFKEKNVNISTSIDGNKELQNKNRPCVDGNSYDLTTNTIRKLQENGFNISAIQTTTKYSLLKYKEIIDEYISLNMTSIFLRPLTKLGKADVNWENSGYSAEEFIEFYKNSLDYIIEINKKGKLFTEGHALIFLKKILKNEPINYMELRSPCGGGIGQLAYYFDGNVYTCDEGRMLAEMGDTSFKVGNVFDDSYVDLMNSECTKATCISSCLECNMFCNSCVYLPYCGTCPVINLAQNKNIFSKQRDYRCSIYSGIMDILFDYIKNDESVLKIFERWIQ